MRDKTLTHKDTSRALEQFVIWDGNYKKPGVADLFKHYNVRIAPTVVFFNSDGDPEETLGGFVNPSEFARDLERVLEGGEGTVTGLRRAVAEAKTGSEDDIQARFSLAGKLEDLGDLTGHDETILSIRDVDPKVKTLAGARAHLLFLQRALNSSEEGECAEGEGECQEGADSEAKLAAAEGECQEKAQCGEECQDGCGEDCAVMQESLARAADWDLEPFYKLAKVAENREGKFEIWDSIASLECNRAELSKAVKAMTEARKVLPSGRDRDWYASAAERLIQSPAEPTSKSKKITLEFADKGVTLASAYRSDALQEMSEHDYNGYLASRKALLARAYKRAGKQKAALATLKECMELSPCDEYEAQLASLQK